MLLLVERHDVLNRPETGVVLDAKREIFAELPCEPCRGCQCGAVVLAEIYALEPEAGRRRSARVVLFAPSDAKVAPQSTDVWNPFLGFDFRRCNRLCRKLEHRCFLTFKQVSQQHHLPVGKFQCIMMRSRVVLVDLQGDIGLANSIWLLD